MFRFFAWLPVCLAVVAFATPAEASFISSIFNKAMAGVRESIFARPSYENSQTIALLEVGKVEALTKKETKKEEKQETEGEIDENASVNIVAGALLPTATPTVALGGGDEDVDIFNEEISVYVVRKGDTLSQIAEMFEITTDTIISANDLGKSAKLSPGDVLFILPFSGVEHNVKKGETLRGIARNYDVPLDDIILFNHLEGSKIVIGDRLIIPGGEILDEKTIAKRKSSSSSSSKSSYSSSSSNAVVKKVDNSGYYGHPLPGSIWVRGPSRTHHGVDLAAGTGTPIYAAASGRVVAAQKGWNGGYGTVVFIKHDNGTRTVYAHMSRLGTSSGAWVSKGEVIGYVGSTGRSTGPHLHFEIKGKSGFPDYFYGR